MRRVLRAIVVLIAGSAFVICGVKGSPRPPSPEAPDAGAADAGAP